ncbi:MAG: site-specific DNA-methyltransferase [Bacillota bacterium]
MNDQPEKLDLRSFDIAEDKRHELLRLFPEVRTEGGKIDFERLKLALGEAVDVGKERYGMNWPGKADCFKTIQTPSLGTLLPCPEESVDFETTENLIIEGDNLEVLKLLQKSYLGKVKMIYIDPPYNTGNDFIYPDNYTESLQTYLEYTGQVDAQGKKFSTNTDTDGRFHSKWLNMMYPRLYLARNLLREDGVIFINMDDNEIGNLKKVCEDVFGEENFVGCFVWRRRASSALAERLISTDHEYVLAFQKSDFISLGIPKEFSAYSNPDNDPRGEWVLGDLTVGMTKDQRPNQYYPLVDPKTGRVFSANPNRVWAYVKQSMDALINDNRIVFPEDPSKRPMLKRFKSELKSDVNPASTWLSEVGLNSEGTKELQEYLGENVTIYPKPSSLIRTLVRVTAEKEDIILDFFAGSGTTAQAVLELNKQDGGNRKFILVQLPEPTGRDDYPTIADICKERVRRVIKKLNDEDAAREPGLFDEDAPKQDRGFRVFKLAESNFKPWNAEVPHDEKTLVRQLELHIDHIREGRTQEDILYEILLKSGFPLTAPVETLQFAGKTVYSVAEGALLICLERELTLELIRAMAERRPERVVCLDEGFAGNDQLKANAVQIFKTKGVTSFKTV